MSPRRPHLRNRKRIKAPRRFDDEDVINSPRQESHEESEESSELEEEIYQSPKPKKPKSKPRAYPGKVTGFDPNLPPAAFPTLDHPDYVHNGGHIALDHESHLSGLQSQEPGLADSEAIDPDLLVCGSRLDDIDLIGNHLIMTSNGADFTRRGSQGVMQNSITVQKQPRATMPSSIYKESGDDGPRNPIWESNMALMEEADRMSDLDRNILEMESSDEEDAAARPTKIARTASVPGFPTWDDLTAAHKLDLADSIAELYELYEDPAQVTHHLRLGVSQGKELVELLIQRQDRTSREKANQQRLQEQAKDVLLQGRRLSQSTFHQMVEENLYETISESDDLQTNLMELKKARAYLRYCGFDPALADSSWDVVPFFSNAAGGIKSKPALTKPSASLSSTAAQTPPSRLKGPFSPRPAQFTPSQQAPYPPDHRLELVQQHNQAALPQHRPIPAYALIAQHSPAAPLSKVPVQSYRVAPGNQSGANYQGATRRSQATLSALSVQPNASTGPDLLAINNALLEARGASSDLPTPQQQYSVPINSRSLAQRGLPTVRENQNCQSSGSSNVRASALHGTGGVVENGDSVNKKEWKKGAI